MNMEAHLFGRPVLGNSLGSPLNRSQNPNSKFKINFAISVVVMTTRGVISDKWSMRVLWACAIGSAIGLYMVAVERQLQNRERRLAESLESMDLNESNDDKL